MRTKGLILTLVLILSLIATGLALANNGFELPRWVLSSGASDSSGGNVRLHATFGQPVVGMVASSNGNVTMGQGFVPDSEPPAELYNVNLPIVLK